MVRERLDDVTRAKGLAISLVVLGHLLVGPPPPGAEWFVAMRTAIYAFHMPFFMFLSGFIFYYTGGDEKGAARPVRYIATRAHRLLLPFLLLGLALTAGQLLMSALHGQGLDLVRLKASVVDLFWTTHASPAQFIWYLAVLFEIVVLTLVVRRVFPSPFHMALLFIPIVAFVPIVHLEMFYLDRLMLYGIFFYVGGIIAHDRARWTAFVDRYLISSTIVFGMVIVLTRILHIYHVSILGCGLASLAVLHGLCRRDWPRFNRSMHWLGDYSFAIYLLNTLFIGATKFALDRVFSWQGGMFYLYLAAMFTAGLFGPVIVKKYFLSRIPALDRITS